MHLINYEHNYYFIQVQIVIAIYCFNSAHYKPRTRLQQRLTLIIVYIQLNYCYENGKYAHYLYRNTR